MHGVISLVFRYGAFLTQIATLKDQMKQMEVRSVALIMEFKDLKQAYLATEKKSQEQLQKMEQKVDAKLSDSSSNDQVQTLSNKFDAYMKSIKMAADIAVQNGDTCNGSTETKQSNHFYSLLSIADNINLLQTFIINISAM